MYEYHEILAMRKVSKTFECYVHWKENEPGQYGDELMTWVKRKDNLGMNLRKLGNQCQKGLVLYYF